LKLLELKRDMEKFISNWPSIGFVPEDYIFPPETRPGNLEIPVSSSIPIIDLGQVQNDDRTNTIQQIIMAAQEFGFFQVHKNGLHFLLC